MPAPDIQPPVYLPDDRVTDAVDAGLRALLSLCFTKKEDCVFWTQRFFRDMPQHRWMIRTKNGRLVAHVACHDKVLRVNDQPLPIGGISEVCVHPDVRGHGLVRIMLRDVHAFLKGRHIPFAVLFGNPDVYRSSGYRLVTNVQHHTPDSTPDNFQWETSDHCLVHPLANQPWPTNPVFVDGRAF